MDMTNKLCVITGANSGIGFETARELAKRGAYIVMVCRNEDKAQDAKEQIIQETHAAGIDIVLCDFSSQDEIRSAANEISNRFGKIDVLINNHGFTSSVYNETVDGLEEVFAVNHIGYFLFTNLLLDNLKASGNARIVNVASNAHKRGEFDPENLQLKNKYEPWKAYGNSKLFNILFTVELAKRIEDSGVTVNCLHPGVIASNFGKTGSWWIRFFFRFWKPFLLTNEEGAQTTIYLATSDEVEGVNGAYFIDSKVATPSSVARNEFAAQKLWDISEKLCGLS